MYTTSHVNLPQDAREELIDMLNTLLANAIDLHWQVKQAHWNIRGTHFYSRHLLFDEVAKHARKHADSYAERAGALGGYAQGTIRLATNNSQLPEYDLQAVDGEAHIRALVERVGRYAASLRDGINKSDEVNDPVTADLLTQTLGETEEDLWFLESHLNGDVRAGVTMPPKGGNRRGRQAEDISQVST
ncbi:DNA starvation/stationary phase protection protein Dps [Corallococcus sp. AB049A]|uniref:DNA starvation/stationary phase protection protein Dps n=1 Tax=Corallococcus interemptor TaxID=2316720 RepID=A0A3A8R0F9_9BACT|nr:MULTISPECIES: DNA starvation/stationary phase protection protein Dps [Corallococcus]RKH54471.1 DNA starvation/stationary phase protection protein Dps [Corallococcus sp. AB050B]RKH68794.1 DNA starvation/stationary phase protection protein Dps [Corallococcus interemptor]RKI70862.1 DNA starvation/stationary phase protection protein Dps [Corallococcus sp. AB049A]